MKKLQLIFSLLFCITVQFATAQTASTSGSKAEVSKPVSPNPGKASPSPKPRVAKKEPRRVHLSGKMPDSVNSLQQQRDK